MRRRRSSTNEPTLPTDAGVEFGWRAHQAIQGWTSSVDTKASIALVIETAVAAAALRALITDKGPLHNATGLHLATSIAAATVLVLAVGCAVLVILPRLDRGNANGQTTGLVYFGHLRHRSAENIARALADLTPDEERRQLAAQLHVTSEVAWRKHDWLQRSLALFPLGAALLVVAFTAF
jgi:pycsar effector protein